MKQKRMIRVLAIFAALLVLSGAWKPLKYVALGDSTDNAQIDAILNALPLATDEASLYTGAELFAQDISLVFEGISDEETMRKILDILQKYNVKATFFLPGINIAENPGIAKAIAQAGHTIGNYLLTGEKYVQDMSAQKQVRSIYRTQKILEEATGTLPALVKCNASDYTNELLKVIKSCGLSGAVSPTTYLNHLSFSAQEQTLPYAARTKWGSVISIKIGQQLDEEEFYLDRVKDLDEKPAIDKQASVNLAPVPTIKPEPVDVSKRLLQTVDWLVGAYVESGFTFVSPEQIHAGQSSTLQAALVQQQKRSGAKAQLFTHALTTKKAVGLCFDAAGSDQQIRSLLIALAKRDIQATFYVYGKDVLNRRSLMLDILSWGHEIICGGFSGASVSGMAYDDVASEIQKGNVILEQELAVTTRFYRPSSGKATDAVLEASFDTGMIPVTYNKAPRPKDGQSVNTVMEYFRQGVHRGDIIFLGTGEYALLPELVSGIADMVSDTGYGFLTVSNLYNGQYQRTAFEDIPEAGSVQVNMDFDPKASTKGYVITRVPVKDKVMFLTFDDWGSDKTITNLLNILKEKGVKASFFIRGEGAKDNPNLLRAIDEAGHDVCNHTYYHRLITEQSMIELQDDVYACYKMLTETLGHVPQLYFRPPQLEKNDEAVNTVLAMGYKYILQSDVSTQDYERPADDVVRYAMRNLGKGRIVVMHMTDNASAGQALADLIDQLTKKGYTLAKLSDYLN